MRRGSFSCQHAIAETARSSGAHGDFWQNTGHFLSHLNETNPVSLGTGLAALTVLILGKIFLKHKPVALFVVIGGIVASTLLGLDAKGVKLLGEVPQGLPGPGLPEIHWSDVNELLPLALACFLLAAVETAAIGRTFTAKHGGRLDANQEFLALAASNLAAGLGRGFPVSGGMSQSLVNEGSGAHTPLSGAIAAGFILIVVLFFSHLLSALPQPVLAAVVLMAVAGLFQVAALKHLWYASRPEFVVAMAALLGVLGSGLLRGVMIGAAISLVQLMRRTSRPHVAVLGRIPGTRRFSDMERHPDNEATPGALIFRPESSLVYFNIDHVCMTILDRVRQESSPPRLVVLDLSAAPYVDLQSAHALADLADELGKAGSRAGGRSPRGSERSFAWRGTRRPARWHQPVHVGCRRPGQAADERPHDLTHLGSALVVSRPRPKSTVRCGSRPQALLDFARARPLASTNPDPGR